jgi:hypothetical protein
MAKSNASMAQQSRCRRAGDRGSPWREGMRHGPPIATSVTSDELFRARAVTDATTRLPSQRVRADRASTTPWVPLLVRWMARPRRVPVVESADLAAAHLAHPEPGPGSGLLHGRDELDLVDAGGECIGCDDDEVAGRRRRALRSGDDADQHPAGTHPTTSAP